MARRTEAEIHLVSLRESRKRQVEVSYDYVLASRRRSSSHNEAWPDSRRASLRR